MQDTHRRLGRIIGALVLLQIIGGILANFIVLAPVFAEPGFLVNGAAYPLRIGVAALAGMATGIATLAVAILLYANLSALARAHALWVLALAIASFVLNVVENMGILSMRSLSESFTAATADGKALSEALWQVVTERRVWAHYLGLATGSLGLLALYTFLLRFALVPRLLAGLGVIAILLQFCAVTMPVLGQPIIMLMIMPVGLLHLILALWLVARGFSPPAPARV